MLSIPVREGELGSEANQIHLPLAAHGVWQLLVQLPSLEGRQLLGTPCPHFKPN